jgi:4'-phosphopantetheinyl transferase
MIQRASGAELWLVRSAGCEAGQGDGLRGEVHAVLRQVLARHVGCEADVPFTLGPHGKPRLATGGPDFSISHSGGYGLVGVAPQGLIGVDIEVSRALHMTSARRLQIVEAAAGLGTSALHASGEPSELAVLRAWVRLEALAKAMGLGIGRLLTRAGVLGGGARCDLRSPMLLQADAGLVVHDLELPGDVVAAVALSDTVALPPLVAWRPEVAAASDTVA